MLALVLVAVAVGSSNLAASIGVGAGGVDRGTRLRVALIFGLLEAGMPIVGLLIGRGLATEVGRETKWLAAVLLVAVGGYGLVRGAPGGAFRRAGPGHPGAEHADIVGSSRPAGPSHPGAEHADIAGALPATGAEGFARTPGRCQSVKLLATGFALSLDNLVAGLALGAYQVSILAGAVVFGTVSTVMSLVGLEFGALIGKRAGGSGEVIGGAVLIGVGVAVGMGAIG